MNKLKPCPFCGSSDLIERDNMYQGSSVLSYWIVCQQCGSESKAAYTSIDAHAAWNIRAESVELTSLREQVKVLREALEACIDLLSNLENIGGFVGLAVINNGQTALDQTKPKEGK